MSPPRSGGWRAWGGSTASICGSSPAPTSPRFAASCRPCCPRACTRRRRKPKASAARASRGVPAQPRHARARRALHRRVPRVFLAGPGAAAPPHPACAAAHAGCHARRARGAAAHRRRRSRRRSAPRSAWRSATLWPRHALASIGADLGAGYFRAIAASAATPTPGRSRFSSRSAWRSRCWAPPLRRGKPRGARPPARCAPETRRNRSRGCARPGGASLATAPACSLTLAPAVDGLPVAGYVAIALVLLGAVLLMPRLAEDLPGSPAAAGARCRSPSPSPS